MFSQWLLWLVYDYIFYMESNQNYTRWKNFPLGFDKYLRPNHMRATPNTLDFPGHAYKEL